MLDLGPVDSISFFSSSMSLAPRICRESLWFGKIFWCLLGTKLYSEYLLTEYITEFSVVKTFVANTCPLSSIAEDHGRWLFSATANNLYLLFAVSALGATSRLTNVHQSRPLSTSPFGPRHTDYYVTNTEAIWLKLRAIQLLNSVIPQAVTSSLDGVIYAIMCLLLISVRSLP